MDPPSFSQNLRKAPTEDQKALKVKKFPQESVIFSLKKRKTQNALKGAFGNVIAMITLNLMNKDLLRKLFAEKFRKNYQV